MNNIELLVLNEQLVSKLYNIYAERFTGEKKFWLKKAEEEKTHTELLEGLQSIMQEIPSFFKEGRFNIEDIKFVASLVNDAINKSENCSLKEALTIAKEIEHSLIEKDFFKVISGESMFVQDAFIRIEKDTKKHREEINELWLKYASK